MSRLITPLGQLVLDLVDLRDEMKKQGQHDFASRLNIALIRFDLDLQDGMLTKTLKRHAKS